MYEQGIASQLTAKLFRLAAVHHPRESIATLMKRFDLLTKHGGLEESVIIEEIEATRAPKTSCVPADPDKPRREEAERRQAMEEREREARRAMYRDYEPRRTLT